MCEGKYKKERNYRELAKGKKKISENINNHVSGQEKL